tara:strand:+ start:455 stop:655 length:201 start_codon:yes stop_codon:yes gene_type:complete
MANSDYRFVHTNDDGMVVVTIPSDNSKLSLDQIKDKDCPKDRPVYTVSKETVPTDRSFRNAWTFTE